MPDREQAEKLKKYYRYSWHVGEGTLRATSKEFVDVSLNASISWLVSSRRERGQYGMKLPMDDISLLASCDVEDDRVCVSVIVTKTRFRTGDDEKSRQNGGLPL